MPTKFPSLDTTALEKKFDSSKIFGMGRGQSTDECHEIPGDEGTCRVTGLIHPSDLCAEHAEVIQIGIPREPEDFIREAVKAGHPRDMLSVHKAGHAQRVAQAVLVSFDDRKAKASPVLEKWQRQARSPLIFDVSLGTKMFCFGGPSCMTMPFQTSSCGKICIVVLGLRAGCLIRVSSLGG